MAIINRLPDLMAKKFGGEDKINMTEIQRDTRLAYSTIWHWVRGHPINRVDTPLLNAWCKYLDVQPGDILEYRED